MEQTDTLPAHKILVVDDEPDLEVLMRQRFRRAIRSGQFEFYFARNGVEALETLRQVDDIAVVLTDINMPKMDGLTLLGELESLNKEANRIAKAVVVSAYGDMQNIRTAMNRGAFDFLVKPIDFQDVEITLGKTLNYVGEVQKSRKAEEYRLGQLVAEANYAQLQELEAVRDGMVHMIVHDLRTPLTGVITGLQSMPHLGELNPLQQEFLAIANNSSEILLNMVNDMLNISKM
jgi:YesN/AraC family two-component response regulator